MTDDSLLGRQLRVLVADDRERVPLAGRLLGVGSGAADLVSADVSIRSG